MNTAAEQYQEAIASPFERWVIPALVMASFVFCFLPPNFSWSQTNEMDFDFTEGALAVKLEFGTIFLLGAWLAWRHPQWTMLRLRQSNIFLFVLVGWCILSFLWSAYPALTLKRAVQLAGFLVVGVAIAPPVGGSRQVLQVLMGTLTLLLAISLMVVAVNPAVGIDTELGNAWRGLFLQKNTTGAAAAVCALLWLRECIASRLFPRTVCVLALLFCLFMLLMSKSSTSLLTFCIGSFLYLLMRRPYITLRQPWWLIGVAFVALVALAVHAFYVFTGHLPGWDDIAGSIGRLFGKNSDLTGRTDIWALVLPEILRHPVLGTGYGAFWLGEGGPSQYIIDALNWIPLQSHNGYLDIINEVGAVGLLLALCVFVRHAMLLGQLMAIDREEAAMHGVLFALLLISNMTESEAFRGLFFYNILFFYSAGSVAAQVAVARVRAAAALEDQAPTAGPAGPAGVARGQA